MPTLPRRPSRSEPVPVNQKEDRPNKNRGDDRSVASPSPLPCSMSSVSSYGQARQTLVSAVRDALQQLRPHFKYDSSSSRDPSPTGTGSFVGSSISSSFTRDRDPAATVLSQYLWSSMMAKATTENWAEPALTTDQVTEATRRHRLGPVQASHVLTVASVVQQWMRLHPEKNSIDAAIELVRLVLEAPDHILRMRASQGPETSHIQVGSVPTPLERRFSPRARRTLAPPPPTTTTTTPPAPMPARPSSSNLHEDDCNRGIPKVNPDDNHDEEADIARVVSIKKRTSAGADSETVGAPGISAGSATPTTPSSSLRPKRGRSAGRRPDTANGSTTADRGTPDGSAKRPRTR